jgi:hypothetical protein
MPREAPVMSTVPVRMSGIIGNARRWRDPQL